MNETTIDRRFTMEERRCWYCGRFWSLEKGLTGTCPKCASNAISKANDRADKLERSNRALRGALTAQKAKP